ncbi:hypothetical protein J7337_011073 [Fusarium musae]|uniref:Uncharacterized protein n=1 Tax=Fusarium musae TaxID=1042133 RepID=A0A9P8DA93_9HYPO|nr:hypothetical protein J7337_011073 [Fusarium musae]KAG9498178.1 hypothetical protein J7337_011073 [Fusarium musae]
MRSTSQALLLGAMLQAANAADVARAAQRNHARDIPAPTITASPIGILDELKLLVGGDGLRIRQADSSSEPLKVTIAPDKTCGYLSGQPGAAVTCENDRLCSWAASSGIGLVACASEIYVSCVESSKAVDPKQCNDVCQSNTFNLLCTNSDTPFCRTYAYPSGIFDYRCASTSVEDVQSVKFTYQGQKNANFVTTTLSDGIASESLSSTNTDRGSADQPSSTDTQTETTTTSEAPEPTKKSTPVGAIVGGVVGGVALIGLIGLGAVCLLRRRKKAEPAPAPAQPVMAQQQAPPPAPINQNPYPQQQHYQPAAQPYPDHSMAASPAPSDARISMMSGPMSSVGPASPGGWHQQPSPPPAFHTPAPAYEMAGPEAREQEPVYEMGSDSVKK